MVEILTRANAFTGVGDVARAGRHAGETQHEVIWKTPVGQAPITDLAIAPDGRTLAVSHFGDGSVSIIDTRSPHVTATVQGQGEPVALAATADRVLVARSAPSYDTVSVIEPGSGALLAEHPVALSVRTVAISRNGRRIYVGRTADHGGDIAVVDTATGDTKVVDMQAGPGSSVDVVGSGRNGRRLYAAVSTAYDGDVAVIDVRRGRVGRRIRIGAPIRDIAVTDGAVGYVLSNAPNVGGVVHVLNTVRDAVSEAIEIGGFPSQFVLSADGKRAYIVDRDRVAVMCLRTNEIVDTIRTAAEPACVAVHPDDTTLYVADYHGYLNAVSIPANVQPYADRLEAVAV